MMHLNRKQQNTNALYNLFLLTKWAIPYSFTTSRIWSASSWFPASYIQHSATKDMDKNVDGKATCDQNKNNDILQSALFSVQVGSEGVKT